MTTYPSDLSGENHYVRLSGYSKKLVLFFGAKALKFYKFNFWQVAHELDANLIFLNNGSNAWYQNGIPSLGEGYKETIQVLQAWKKCLNITDVYAVGTSMGGYAALQYGCELEAKTLAFATEIELSIPFSRSEKYIVPDTVLTASDLRAALKKHKYAPTLIIGESDPRDIFSASQLQLAVPKTTVISLQGADHYTPSYLSRSSRLFSLLSNFINDNPTPDLYDAGLAVHSKLYPKYVYEAYIHYQQSNWEDCIAQSNKALGAYPFGDAALYLLGQSLMKCDKFNLAAEKLSLAAVIAPYNADYAFTLSHAIRSTGAIQQAKIILARGIQKFPSHARSHYALGIIALQKNELIDAYTHVQRACYIQPNNDVFSSRLENIRCLIDT